MLTGIRRSTLSKLGPEDVVKISLEELQKRRSPADLRRFADGVQAAVRADPAEFERGMRKTGLYKEFLDEIRPLAWFAERQYLESFTVQPVLGNQGYDVIVYNASGQEHERLELTKPHDGGAAARDARFVLERGVGEFRVDNPGDDFVNAIPRIVATCEEKAIKDYRDCTLVIVITPQRPYAGFEDRFERTLEQLVRHLSGIRFKAKRVLLFVHPDRVVPVVG